MSQFYSPQVGTGDISNQNDVSLPGHLNGEYPLKRHWNHGVLEDFPKRICGSLDGSDSGRSTPSWAFPPLNANRIWAQGRGRETPPGYDEDTSMEFEIPTFNESLADYSGWLSITTADDQGQSLPVNNYDSRICYGAVRK